MFFPSDGACLRPAFCSQARRRLPRWRPRLPLPRATAPLHFQVRCLSPIPFSPDERCLLPPPFAAAVPPHEPPPSHQLALLPFVADHDAGEGYRADRADGAGALEARARAAHALAVRRDAQLEQVYLPRTPPPGHLPPSPPLLYRHLLSDTLAPTAFASLVIVGAGPRAMPGPSGQILPYLPPCVHT